MTISGEIGNLIGVIFIGWPDALWKKIFYDLLNDTAHKKHIQK